MPPGLPPLLRGGPSPAGVAAHQSPKIFLPAGPPGSGGSGGDGTPAAQEEGVAVQGPSGAFQRLLDEVAREHAREVAELGDVRRQNAALLRQLHRVRAGTGLTEQDVTGITSEPLDRHLWVAALPGSVDTEGLDTLRLAADGQGDGAREAREIVKQATGEGSVRSAARRSSFRIKPAWLEEMDSERVQVAKHHVTLGDMAVTRKITTRDDTWLQRFISYPSSPPRIAWDAFGALLIFYDLFAIPLTIAFHPPESTYTIFVDWSTMVFWTANMGASFLVGYVKDGVTHMAPARIAMHYVRTWLLVDLLVVVPDWVLTMASVGKEEKSTEGNSVKLLRTFRLLRMVRLLRLFKLRNIVNNLDELIDTEYMSIFINIAKMILLLLVINHYICCVWFMIGESSESTTWVKEYAFDSADWNYQFFTSFHWAITQFTPASMSVQPQNVRERFFAIAVVVFALVGFAYVVGSITGSLTQLRSMQESASKQFWNLRRCLKQNKIPFALSARVLRYLEHAWKDHQKNMSTDAIPLFSLLSEQLKYEIRSAMFVPHVSVHPLFHHLCTVSSLTVGRLASGAISRKAFAQNDTVFMPGENATHMSFIRTGMLQYCKVTSEGQEKKEWVEKCEDWIAEPVMWLPSWAHLGSLVATFECELLLLDPEKFCHIVHLNPSVYQLVSTYAQNFLYWLNSVESDDLSDIWQGEYVGEQVRQLMGVDEPQRKNTQGSLWTPVSRSRSVKGFLKGKTVSFRR